MPEITVLKAGKKDRNRVNVFLDGKFSFSIPAEVAVREGLRTGQELAEGQITVLTRADQFQRCLDTALRYLSYRPRSEAEIKVKLRQRGFSDDLIEKVLRRLRDNNLIDDAAFARFWRENRQAFSPRSQWLTRTELHRKGVSAEIIDATTVNLNDIENAHRAALNRAQRLASQGYQTFRRRLADFLRRRGFGYEVINQTVNRLWQEHGGNAQLSEEKLNHQEERRL